eukprot:UN34603
MSTIEQRSSNNGSPRVEMKYVMNQNNNNHSPLQSPKAFLATAVDQHSSRRQSEGRRCPSAEELNCYEKIKTIKNLI